MKIKNFLSHPIIQIWLIWGHLKQCQPVKLVWSEEEEGIEGQKQEEGGSSSTSRGSSSRSAKQRRSQRRSSFQVFMIVVSKQIKTQTELLALAIPQKAQEKPIWPNSSSTEAQK